MFPECQAASAYNCGRTTYAILNEALFPHCHNFILEQCMMHSFTLETYGSSGSKMNSGSMHIFDVSNSSKTVTNHFYDIYLTEGVDDAKAASIFESVEELFTKDGLPWENCVSFSMNSKVLWLASTIRSLMVYSKKL